MTSRKLCSLKNNSLFIPFSLSSDTLVAGMMQDVTVRLHAGNVPIDPGSKVSIMPTADLQIVTSYPDNTVIIGEDVARGNTTEWKMTVLQEADITGGKTIDNKVNIDVFFLK